MFSSPVPWPPFLGISKITRRGEREGFSSLYVVSKFPFFQFYISALLYEVKVIESLLGPLSFYEFRIGHSNLASLS